MHINFAYEMLKFLELSRRPTTNIQPRATSTLAPEIEVIDEVNSETENKTNEQEEENVLSNPYYSRLLDSKLDSCPQQPFNETTNIIYSAVYDTFERASNIENMSRWEQVQRGYIRQESISQAIYNQRRNHRFTEYERYEYEYNVSRTQWVNTIFDVNDLLQTHDSLDDCIRNHKQQTNSITLAKATGSLDKSLDKLLDANRTDKQMMMDGQEVEPERIDMRNDVKWRKRKIKVHRRKKRMDSLRMKKKANQQRNRE